MSSDFDPFISSRFYSMCFRINGTTYTADRTADKPSATTTYCMLAMWKKRLSYSTFFCASTYVLRASRGTTSLPLLACCLNLRFLLFRIASTVSLRTDDPWLRLPCPTTISKSCKSTPSASESALSRLLLATELAPLLSFLLWSRCPDLRCCCPFGVPHLPSGRVCWMCANVK